MDEKLSRILRFREELLAAMEGNSGGEMFNIKLDWCSFMQYWWTHEVLGRRTWGVNWGINCINRILDLPRHCPLAAGYKLLPEVVLQCFTIFRKSR